MMPIIFTLILMIAPSLVAAPRLLPAEIRVKITSLSGRPILGKSYVTAPNLGLYGLFRGRDDRIGFQARVAAKKLSPILLCAFAQGHESLCREVHVRPGRNLIAFALKVETVPYIPNRESFRLQAYFEAPQEERLPLFEELKGVRISSGLEGNDRPCRNLKPIISGLEMTCELERQGLHELCIDATSFESACRLFVVRTSASNPIFTGILRFYQNQYN